MSDEAISLLIPTRNRINTTHGNFVYDLIESARLTADNPDDIEFVFYVDADDKSSLDYFNSFSDPLIRVVSGDRIVLSQMWNECYEESCGDILGHCGDDLRFRTQGWDSVIASKFAEYPDRIAFVYGRDGYAPKTFGTHGFIHRNWVEAVGYFVPPYFSSDFNDNWLNEVAQAVGRHFYVDVYTEHMHPAAGKYVMDQTHTDRVSRGEQDRVHEKYNSLKAERDADANALLKFIQDFGEQ
jgi:hypothetical protein